MLVFNTNHSLHINISICQTTHRHTALHSSISSNTHSTMRLLKMFFFFSPAAIPWRSLVWLRLVVVTQKSIFNVSRDSIFFCVIAELTNIPPAQIDVRLGTAARICTRSREEVCIIVQVCKCTNYHNTDHFSWLGIALRYKGAISKKAHLP